MTWNRLVSLFNKIRSSCILTVRGTLLASAGLYLLLIPVMRHQDLVASVISITLLLVIAIFALGTLLLRFQLRKISDWHILPPAKSVITDAIHSKEPVTLLCKMPAFSLLPLYELQVQVYFREADIDPLTIRIVGNSKTLSHVPVAVTFPHRGRWHPHHFELSIGDQLGLTMLSWNSALSTTTEIEVEPPFIPDYAGKFPILSSSFRTGDSLPDLHTRMGDYYDIKQYQPGDNLNKILWQAFARTGELYARHPERSMTPEGTVVFYIPAHREDDDLAVSAIEYARLLEDNGIEIIGSCYGAEEREIASSSDELKELLIDSVWSIEDEVRAEEQLWQFLSSIQADRPSLNIHRVLLFCKEAHLIDEEALNEYVQLGSILQRNRIAPVYCVHEILNNKSSVAIQQRRAVASGGAIEEITAAASNLFLIPADKSIELPAPIFYPEFLRMCMRHHWEVVS